MRTLRKLSKKNETVLLNAFRKSKQYDEMMRLAPGGHSSEAHLRDKELRLATRWQASGGDRRATKLEKKGGFFKGVWDTVSNGVSSIVGAGSAHNLNQASNAKAHKMTARPGVETTYSRKGLAVNKGGKFVGRGVTHNYRYHVDPSGNKTNVVGRDLKGKFQPNNNTYRGGVNANNALVDRAYKSNIQGVRNAYNLSVANGMGIMAGIGHGLVQSKLINKGNEVVDHILEYPGERGYAVNDRGAINDYMGDPNTSKFHNYVAMRNGERVGVNFGGTNGVKPNELYITPEGKLAYPLGNKSQLNTNSYHPMGAAMGRRMSKEYMTPEQARMIENTPYFKTLPPEIQEKVGELSGEAISNTRLPEVTVTARRKRNNPSPASYIPLGPMEEVKGVMPRIGVDHNLQLPQFNTEENDPYIHRAAPNGSMGWEDNMRDFVNRPKGTYEGTFGYEDPYYNPEEELEMQLRRKGQLFALGFNPFII